MTHVEYIDSSGKSFLRKLALVADAAEEFFKRVVVARDAAQLTDTLIVHIDAPTWYVLKRRVEALREGT